MMRAKQIQTLVMEIILNKGFTANADGDLVRLDKGYMVSLEGLYLGAWLDEQEGFVYIDVSSLQETKEAAIKFGIKNKQKAIFDNKNRVVINL
jgi:hypothetical protein